MSDDAPGSALLAPDPGPIPISMGTYAIYNDGSGGFVLVATADGVEHKKHIPAKLVKLISGTGAIGKLFRGQIG